MIEEQLTGEIIKVFYKVFNTLGHGFLEKIYHQAMIIELRNAGFRVETKKQIEVFYGGIVIGEFETDLIIDDKIILELKAKETLSEAHEAQLINYLRATKLEIGLLLNFGKTPQFKRKYFSNENKNRTGAKLNLLESFIK